MAWSLPGGRARACRGADPAGHAVVTGSVW